MVAKVEAFHFSLMELYFLIDCKTTAATSATAAQNQSIAATDPGQCILSLSSDFLPENGI